jgi:HSP20 family protein
LRKANDRQAPQRPRDLVEERSYGSFYRSMFLPFEPEDGAVDAHFDKGVLHLTIKKPAKAIKTTKTINIKTGAAPSKAA